jgi:hypothetical protein
VHSFSLYLIVLLAVVVTVALLPVIKVDISTQARGFVRTVSENTPITSVVSGRITFINLKNNQSVQKGDTLLMVETSPLDVQTQTNTSQLSDFSLVLSDLERVTAGSTSLQTGEIQREYQAFIQKKTELQAGLAQVQRVYDRNKNFIFVSKDFLTKQFLALKIPYHLLALLFVADRPLFLSQNPVCCLWFLCFRIGYNNKNFVCRRNLINPMGLYLASQLLPLLFPNPLNTHHFPFVNIAIEKCRVFLLCSLVKSLFPCVGDELLRFLFSFFKTVFLISQRYIIFVYVFFTYFMHKMRGLFRKSFLPSPRNFKRVKNYKSYLIKCLTN